MVAKPQIRGLFLSTSSARRTTHADVYASKMRLVSIHVLREEDDMTPRRYEVGGLVSIHVLREEDDANWRWLDFDTPMFLSTSSARRTTAYNSAIA